MATMERAKLRAVVLHWTRPVRLIGRAIVARGIYGARFVRRLPVLIVRLGVAIVRRGLMRPARWVLHRGKVALHAYLVRRKGAPDQVS
jgi:hypothetical protein